MEVLGNGPLILPGFSLALFLQIRLLVLLYSVCKLLKHKSFSSSSLTKRNSSNSHREGMLLHLQKLTGDLGLLVSRL